MPMIPPVSDSKRVYAVDALRGFAVISIMLLHFLEHFIYNSYPPNSLFDTTLKDAMFFLFAGKSYTIFALLFGFTFAIQSRNQEARGHGFAGRFAWRMLLLAGFASFNAIFFPGGDVLMTFAIAGLVMIPLSKLSIGKLTVIGFFFLAQPLDLAYALVQSVSPDWAPPVVCKESFYPTLTAYVDAGDFFAMAWQNLTLGQYTSLAWGIDAGRLMQAPGLFVMGCILCRGNYFAQSEENNRFWVRTLLICSFAAVAFYVAMSAVNSSSALTVLSMWHNVGFTGFWVAGFVLLYQHEYFRKLTTALLSYGRMSLTNYVSQSVIGSLIFFPYALGLAPYLGYAASFAAGFIVMVFQIKFCECWLARHKHGPLEGIWHKLTWLKSGR